jgi:F-type H+-transporting ATPase subunit gamma
MALKDIKAKIKATERTHKVTRAMEAVSAVKMRKTQEAALSGRPYARAALSVLARLSGSEMLHAHPLMTERPVTRVSLLILTSDKGLAGALNSGVIKAAAAAVSEYAPEDVQIFGYGKRGEEYFARRGYRVVRSFENKRDTVELSVMEELARTLSKSFVTGETDLVLVAYSNFKSTFEQVPMVRRLLPLSLPTTEQWVEDIIPEKGKYADTRTLESPASYEVEPEGDEVVEYLLPRLVSVSLYHALLEAKASEHSARMVAMKNASDKSEEVAHDLTRLFNKIRQAGITREVSEIVGGREALAT